MQHFLPHCRLDKQFRCHRSLQSRHSGKTRRRHYRYHRAEIWVDAICACRKLGRVKMQKLAKVISILTVAPLMALVLLSWLYCADPALFGGLFQYLLAVLFLVVFPILAYPLQKILLPFAAKAAQGKENWLFPWPCWAIRLESSARPLPAPQKRFGLST